jgi:uncharacterized membrane protein YbaN (DUF454 family)
MAGLNRILFLALGWFFVALATVGIFLPLIPTTPFLLLAGSCFIRSSPRCRRWLVESRWFGPHLRDWDEHRAVRRPVKLLATVVVTAVIVVTLLRDLPWPVHAAVVTLGGVGLLVIWRLRTLESCAAPTPPTAEEQPASSAVADLK